MENQITLFTIFAAGVGSFLTPCILPVVPTYAAILAGDKQLGRSRPGSWLFMRNTLCFLTGFILVFVAMGATASYLGGFFYEYQDGIRKAGALFMILMGIHLSGMVKFSLLERECRPLLTGAFNGPVGAFMLGIASSAGWTPCTGPILASILVYAGTAATVTQGAFMLLVYAMGFSMPFFLFVVLVNRYVGKLKALYNWLPVIHKIAGVLLIIIGSAVYFDLMHWLLRVFF